MGYLQRRGPHAQGSVLILERHIRTTDQQADFLALAFALHAEFLRDRGSLLEYLSMDAAGGFLPARQAVNGCTHGSSPEWHARDRMQGKPQKQEPGQKESTSGDHKGGQCALIVLNVRGPCQGLLTLQD